MSFHLGLDLDGVVADYPRGFADFLGKKFGVDPLSLSTPTKWSVAECPHYPMVEDLEHYFELHAEAVRNAMFATMPAYGGAAESIARLRRQGVYVRIITHRFITGTDKAQVMADTGDWLKLWNIEYDDICFVKDKSAVGCDLLIDDSPANLEAYRDANLRYVIFDQPYNRHVAGPRVCDWAGAESFIFARAGLI